MIRESGIAALVVDKSINAVSKIADCILVLVKGTLVFDGSPAGVMSYQDFMHRNLGV